MPCYHPLKAFWTGSYTETGKKDYIITKTNNDFLSLDSAMRSYSNKTFDKHNLKLLASGHYVLDDHCEVPCGKCIGCKLAYSRTWAQRCMLEARTTTNNFFITLTFNDENLPSDLSVQKKTLSGFVKRLRQELYLKNGHTGLRFYGCGEYGSQFGRPHYHLIVFNCPLDDLMVFNTNFQGDIFYRSPLVEKCWKYGFSYVGEVNYQTCAYVARYVTKKITGPMADDWYQGRNPEFVLMSRRPGIAKDYFDANMDSIYENDEILMLGKKKGKPTLIQLKPSKYYDKLYDNLKPDEYAKVREKRIETARLVTNDKLNLYNCFNDKFSMLEHEEQCVLHRLERLTRDTVK